MDIEKQNADLTFKFNKDIGRHGWLRLTPAYSVKMVEKILDSLNYKPIGVFEPFSGTGTTELVCANRGVQSFAFDINPFLVWLASTKSAIYSNEILTMFWEKVEDIVTNIEKFEPFQQPSIYHIERWWKPKALEFLSRLKTAIWSINEKSVKDLLKIVFCRIIIETSNAAFNHVSTSFKDDTAEESFTFGHGKTLFLQYAKMIYETAKLNPTSQVNISLHDSTEIPRELFGCFDTLITSPPYPNRISYIRELRPYMYWLDYLKVADDASELDWNTIGGTWGAATSKLSSWTPKTDLIPKYLFDIANQISKADNKSASLMANYVLKYFDDMAMHFQTVYNNICNNGTVHYIVGNSNFYGNTVPSDKLYVDMLIEIGFRNPKVEIIRKRNCNKALFEYWVSAKK